MSTKFPHSAIIPIPIVVLVYIIWQLNCIQISMFYCFVPDKTIERELAINVKWSVCAAFGPYRQKLRRSVVIWIWSVAIHEERSYMQRSPVICTMLLVVLAFIEFIFIVLLYHYHTWPFFSSNMNHGNLGLKLQSLY